MFVVTRFSGSRDRMNAATTNSQPMPEPAMNDVKLAHPSLDQLAAFSQGRLSEAEIAELSAHLGACPECLATVEASGDDTLISLLRAADTAHDREAKPNPGEAETLAPAAVGPAIQGLPAQLAQHGRYRVQE